MHFLQVSPWYSKSRTRDNTIPSASGATEAPIVIVANYMKCTLSSELADLDGLQLNKVGHVVGEVKELASGEL